MAYLAWMAKTDISASVFAVPAVIMLPFLIWVPILSLNAELLCARLGAKVEVPCRTERIQQPEAKWYYSKSGASSFLISSGKDGVSRRNTNLQANVGIASNFILVIDAMTKENEGNYSCHVCKNAACEVKNTSLLLLKGKNLMPAEYSLKRTRIFKSINMKFQHALFPESPESNITKATAAPGSVFIQSCPTKEVGKMDHSATVKWTFQPIGKLGTTFTLNGRSAMKRPGTMGRRKMLINGSIYVSDVDSSDAGNYSCWIERHPCDWLSLLTVNLCIQTEDKEEVKPHPKIAVLTGILVPALIALLLFCIVLLCRYRRTSELTSAKEQLSPECCYRSSKNSRAEISEIECVYSLLNIPEQNRTIEGQEICIYSLIKMPSACNSVD